MIPPPAIAGEKQLPGLAYTAYPNGVQCEVTQIHSGHLVVLTYALFFEPPIVKVESTQHDFHKPSVRDTLESLLADDTFLPNGGELAFGVQHDYGVKDLDQWEDRNVNQERRELTYLMDLLRGGDATLRDVCESLSLDIHFALVYSLEKKFEDELIITRRLASMQGSAIESFDDVKVSAGGGRFFPGLDEDIDELRSGYDPVHDDEEIAQEKVKTFEDVCWVTPLTEFTQFMNYYCYAIPNYHDSTYDMWGRGCLIVKVGTRWDRKTLVST